MSENIFWSTLAISSRSTGVADIQEIDFLMNELKPNAQLDERARCFRECLKGDVISQKENRAKILSKLDPEKLERLCTLAKIPSTTLLDSGYELSQEESRNFEDVIGASNSRSLKRVEAVQSGLPDQLVFKYSLFKHQRAIADKIISLSLSQERGCIVHMPTGSGKTRTAMWSICRLITEHSLSCCWITYNKTLITQAIDEFQKAWGMKGEGTCRIGYLTGEKESEDVSGVDMLFASFGKLSIDARTEDRKYIAMIAQNIDILFIDEAHEAQADGRGIAVRAIRFMKPEIKVFGLTATPGKSPEGFNDEDYDLAEHFQQNKVVLEIEGYDNPIDYLINEEYLSRPNYFEIGGDWRGDPLAETLGVIQSVIHHSSEHRRIIVFCGSVESSRKCAAFSRLIGIKSFHVDGETPEGERNEAKEVFNSNIDTTVVLFNYNVLATGFDVPQTTLVLICRPVNSIVLLSQMIGRGLRGPRAGGTPSVEIGLILNHRDPESLSIAGMFMNWEHLWATS